MKETNDVYKTVERSYILKLITPIGGFVTIWNGQASW